MHRNVAGQTIELFAFDPDTGLPVTGGAASLVAYVSIDGGPVTALVDTSAAEVDATNAAGWYRWDLAQAETDGARLLFTATAAAGVVVVGRAVDTVTDAPSAADIDTALTATHGAGSWAPGAPAPSAAAVAEAVVARPEFALMHWLQAGVWRDKPSTPGVVQILDPTDGTTVRVEITVRETSPYQQVTVL